MNVLTAISKGLKTVLMSTWKKLFAHASVSSNVAFTIVLLIAEKIVEMDFTCPCGSKSRFHFSLLLFLIPGIVAIVLMTAVFFKCECSIKKNVNNFCVCIFPAAVWVTLLFLDGRYYTCMKTDWLGQYVTVNYNVLEKWCEPDNRTSYDERLKKSEEWYALSQICGLYLFGVLSLWVLVIMKVLKDNNSADRTSAGNDPENDLQNSTSSPSTSGGNDPDNLLLQRSTSSPSTSGGNDPDKPSPSTNTTPV